MASLERKRVVRHHAAVSGSIEGGGAAAGASSRVATRSGRRGFILSPALRVGSALPAPAMRGFTRPRPICYHGGIEKGACEMLFLLASLAAAAPAPIVVRLPEPAKPVRSCMPQGVTLAQRTAKG